MWNVFNGTVGNFFKSEYKSKCHHQPLICCVTWTVWVSECGIWRDSIKKYLDTLFFIFPSRLISNSIKMWRGTKLFEITFLTHPPPYWMRTAYVWCYKNWFRSVTWHHFPWKKRIALPYEKRRKLKLLTFLLGIFYFSFLRLFIDSSE